MAPPAELLARVPGPVVAFAMNNRAVGCAFFDRAHPLVTRRRLRDRGIGIEGVEGWVTRLLRRCQPFVVVIVVDPRRQARSSRYCHLRDLLRAQVEAANVSSLELSREEVGKMLGLVAQSDRALSDAVAHRVPHLASHLKRSRLIRTDSEREWTPALVAAAAALGAVHLLTCDVKLPSE